MSSNWLLAGILMVLLLLVAGFVAVSTSIFPLKSALQSSGQIRGESPADVREYFVNFPTASEGELARASVEVDARSGRWLLGSLYAAGEAVARHLSLQYHG